jgi:hypothetical protein
MRIGQLEVPTRVVGIKAQTVRPSEGGSDRE